MDTQTTPTEPADSHDAPPSTPRKRTRRKLRDLDARLFVTIQEAADLMAVSRSTIDALMANGTLPFVRMGRNLVRLNREAIAALGRTATWAHRARHLAGLKVQP